jgi:thiol-disulfide isomerase/thioredoxin
MSGDDRLSPRRRTIVTMNLRALAPMVILVVTACSAPSPSVPAAASLSGTPSSTQASPSGAGETLGDRPIASAESSPPDSSSADPLLTFELTDVRSGDTFTLGELAADKPVLVEAMAIWCTTCLAQQREVVVAHQLTEFNSVGIDVDPNERTEDLADYSEREGFDWRFAMADAELVQLLTDRYGFGVTNPPSTPTFVVTADGDVRALEFGRVRSADELVAELDAD